MPPYRQATLPRRFGGDISSNTLAASVVRVGLATRPVINLMGDVLLDSELIYGDATTFQVLKEVGRRPQSKSYRWAHVNGSGPPFRMFSYSPGPGAQHAQRIYAGTKPGGVLMSDGYELYNRIAHDHQLVHLGCWSHVGRGFIKAEETVPKAARTPDPLATRFIGLIGKLFAVEARSPKWAGERRQRLRARYSSRVLAIIARMMVEQLPTVVPSSLLGKALQYLRGQWSKLVRYVENGNWPISNNCENAISPFVVGRKGWLFADTVAGAQASATHRSRPARRMAPIHTAISPRCSRSCPSLQPLTTMRHSCPGRCWPP
ncbi:transposase IS66 [Burkholderia sp. H160]|nr:transposase IS66 [Burkholderia sp. H160]